MSWTRLKVWHINLLVFAGLMCLLEILSFFIISFTGNTKPIHVDEYNISSEQDDFRRELRDFRTYKYKAFVGWSANERTGSLLNIDESGRRYSEFTKESSRKVAFFGGSTMWGYGVSDINTIPSFVSREGKIKAVNYAEQAYNSRQSLNLLIANEARLDPGESVVFFDGVNDVYHNCLKKNSTSGHAREGYFNNLLKSETEARKIISVDWARLTYSVLSFSWTARLIYSSQDLDLNKLSAESYSQEVREYVCDQKVLANEVADFLVGSWSSAERILSAKGVNFKCILQPNPYTLAKSSHYSDDIWRKAVHDVYPIIREKAKSLSCYVDGSDWLDKDYYIDGCCHVNKEGNAAIARNMLNLLNK